MKRKRWAVCQKITVHITGCTLLSTVTLKHANTAANKQSHTYLIYFDYTLVISDIRRWVHKFPV